MVDDPVTERVRKNTQIVSDAAYKGVHPHIVEMDRRPGIIVGKLLNAVAIEDTLGVMKASACVLHYNHEKALPDFIFTLFSVWNLDWTAGSTPASGEVIMGMNGRYIVICSVIFFFQYG